MSKLRLDYGVVRSRQNRAGRVNRGRSRFTGKATTVANGAWLFTMPPGGANRPPSHALYKEQLRKRRFKGRMDSEIRKIKRSNRELKKEILQERRAVALLRRREAALRETISDLEAFSLSLSHDIRSPLRTMRSFSQILVHEYSEKMDAVGVDHLNRIARAAARLDLLIEDVLNYSMTSREKLTLTPLAVAPLIRTIVNERPNLAIHAGRIQIRGKLKLVLGHPAAMTQCLSNLLENAIKFVRPGDAPKINIFTRGRGDCVRLCIQDFGIGLGKKPQRDIIEPVESLNPRVQYPGTGLGLAIVRKCVERMGGKLGVAPNAPQGSLFCLELRAAGSGGKPG